LKKELVKNGPVIGMMTLFNDFMTYSDGIYMRGEDSIKVADSHLVKVLGWNKREDGLEYWIIENTFGAEWGKDGIGYVYMQDQSVGLQYGMGTMQYPFSMAEYEQLQQQMKQAEDMKNVEEEFEEETEDIDVEEKEDEV
jgi:hypothetical protein